MSKPDFLPSYGDDTRRIIYLKNNKTGVISRLTVEVDPDPIDPRDDDGDPVKIVSWDERYPGDRDNPFSDPDDFYAWAQKQKDIVIGALDLYDHSGLSLSVCQFDSPFASPSPSCGQITLRWDTSRIGWAYLTKDAYEKCLGKKAGREWKKDFEKMIRADIETQDEFLNGEVYWFSLEQARHYEIVENGRSTIRYQKGWEEVNSCGGYFGDNVLENGISDMIGGIGPSKVFSTLQKGDLPPEIQEDL